MRRFLFILWIALGLTALWLFVRLLAVNRDSHWRVAVSQCGHSNWRNAMDEEIRREAEYLGTMDLTFAYAGDNSRRQSEQIDSIVASGVDLIIVAPNEREGVTDAVRRARKAGVRIVVIDRRLSAPEYDGYVGTDNFALGYSAGVYAAAYLQGKGTVLEVGGLKGSSPAMGRHSGFVAALSEYPGIRLIGTVEGRWKAHDAVQAFDDAVEDKGMPDLVFAHNDEMALAISDAHTNLQHRLHIIGVDGLDGGLDGVASGRLLATFVNPTGGAKAVRKADSLLHDRRIQRDCFIPAEIVDGKNERVLRQQMSVLNRRQAQIDEYSERVAQYIRGNAAHGIVLFATVFCLFVVVGACLFIFRAYRAKTEAHQRLKETNERLAEMNDNLASANARLAEAHATMKEQYDKIRTQRDQLAFFSQELKETNDSFEALLRDVVERNYADPAFDVEQLAEALCITRSQLFRKVKALCDTTPSQVIRTARLRHAAEMLATPNITVSEVCYATGFSNPSYFSKVFREAFGCNPGAMDAAHQQPAQEGDGH